jgi:hypothetical protein
VLAARGRANRKREIVRFASRGHGHDLARQMIKEPYSVCEDARGGAGGLSLLGSGGVTITSVETWRQLAAPRGKDSQWVDGRSAKELATGWCVTGAVCPPAEFAKLLDSHDLTRDAQHLEGYAEWKTGLRGEHAVRAFTTCSSSPSRRVRGSWSRWRRRQMRRSTGRSGNAGIRRRRLFAVESGRTGRHALSG